MPRDQPQFALSASDGEPTINAGLAQLPLRDACPITTNSCVSDKSFFYRETVTSDGLLIRQHPDGSRELIRMDEHGVRYVERSV